MRTVEEIVEDIKLPSPQARLRLVDKIAVLGQSESSTQEAQVVALDVFLALAGTVETDDTNVSSDKYKHLADIYADDHELS